MADVVLEKGRFPAGVVVGSQLIDIVTGGMYNNPLMVLREYIQNSVDSLDVAYRQGNLQPGEGQINVRLNGMERTISVTDNGAGVPTNLVPTLLCSLGCSSKDRFEQRGFRGIGRLGGLGYCDKLVFETRSSPSEPISVVCWDATKLYGSNEPGIRRATAQEAIERAATISLRESEDGDPVSFFRVTMKNVHRFHRDELMNPKAVSDFLAKVAPVDFDEVAFPFAREIRDHVSQMPGYCTYAVFMNGEKILKPHTREIIIDGKPADNISRIELFDIKNSDGVSIGRGWFAVSSFLSAFSANIPMRGIRLRQGNIEVGDEYSLADLYSERRFATWQIGEVHLDYSVKANARRDGFEQVPNYETLLEQMSFLCRQLSTSCRDSSKRRGKVKAAETAIERLETLLQLQVVLDREDMLKLSDVAEARLKDLEEINSKPESVVKLRARLDYAKTKLTEEWGQKPEFVDLLDGRVLRYSEPREMLRILAKSIIANYDGKMSRDRLLTQVFEPYLTPRANAIFSEEA